MDTVLWLSSPPPQIPPPLHPINKALRWLTPQPIIMKNSIRYTLLLPSLSGISIPAKTSPETNRIKTIYQQYQQCFTPISSEELDGEFTILILRKGERMIMLKLGFELARPRSQNQCRIAASSCFLAAGRWFVSCRVVPCQPFDTIKSHHFFVVVCLFPTACCCFIRS